MDDERNDLDPDDLDASRAESEILRRLERIDRNTSTTAHLLDKLSGAINLVMAHPLVKRHLR